MGLTSSVFAALLQDTDARKVLAAIAREKKLYFRDLAKVFQLEHIEGQDANKALELLKTAGLIEEETAPISDFHTYYVTAEGLSTERQLRRLKAA
jgi:predicted DNA-binding ArsR family transcriptional regulator